MAEAPRRNLIFTPGEMMSNSSPGLHELCGPHLHGESSCRGTRLRPATEIGSSQRRNRQPGRAWLVRHRAPLHAPAKFPHRRLRRSPLCGGFVPRKSAPSSRTGRDVESAISPCSGAFCQFEFGGQQPTGGKAPNGSTKTGTGGLHFVRLPSADRHRSSRALPSLPRGSTEGT